MAKFHQGEAVVSFDDSADALTDYSSGVKVASFNLARDAGQEAHIGADWKDGFLGARGVTGSLEVYDGTTAHTALMYRLSDTSAGDAITLQIDAPDSSNGSDRHSGEVQIISADSSFDRNGTNGKTTTFNWQSSGTWTKSTISA